MPTCRRNRLPCGVPPLLSLLGPSSVENGSLAYTASVQICFPVATHGTWSLAPFWGFWVRQRPRSTFIPPADAALKGDARKPPSAALLLLTSLASAFVCGPSAYACVAPFPPCEFPVSPLPPLPLLRQVSRFLGMYPPPRLSKPKNIGGGVSRRVAGQPDNACRGIAALRHVVLSWMPE